MSKASKRLSGLNEAAIVDHETRQEDKRFTVCSLCLVGAHLHWVRAGLFVKCCHTIVVVFVVVVFVILCDCVTGLRITHVDSYSMR